MMYLCTLNLGMNSHFHVLLLCWVFFSRAQYSELKEWWKNLASASLNYNLLSTRWKHLLTLKKTSKCELSEVRHLASFWQPSFHLLVLQTSKARVVVLGSPGSCHPFTASMMQCWTTAAQGGMKHILTAGSSPECIITSLLSSLHPPAAQALQHTLAPWVWTSTLLVTWTNPKFLSGSALRSPTTQFCHKQASVSKNKFGKADIYSFKNKWGVSGVEYNWYPNILSLTSIVIQGYTT